MAKQMILSRSRFQLLDVYSSLVNPTDEFGLYVCAPQQEEEDGGGCGGGGGGVGEEDNIMPYSSSSFLFMQPVMHGEYGTYLRYYFTLQYSTHEMCLLGGTLPMPQGTKDGRQKLSLLQDGDSC